MKKFIRLIVNIKNIALAAASISIIFFSGVCSANEAPESQSSVTQSSVVQAASSPTSGSPIAIGSGDFFGEVMFGLLIVLACIFAISWFVKHFTHGTLSSSKHMRVLTSLPLGTRERAVLVQVGDQQLLLGVTTTQINLLHTFEAPVLNDGSGSDAGVSDFTKKIKEILSKGNAD